MPCRQSRRTLGKTSNVLSARSSVELRKVKSTIGAGGDGADPGVPSSSGAEGQEQRSKQRHARLLSVKMSDTSWRVNSQSVICRFVIFCIGRRGRL